jgi:two-component system, chemotaxis family, CheB/CheR fusion protein
MSNEVALRELLEELAEQRGLDVRGYKRTTLERRFRRRMFQVNVESYAEYAEYVGKHPDEINQLLSTILINVTEFFRDPPAWEILRHEVLPPMLKQLKPGGSFRAWSAGCASGAEAYSIAIILAELLGPRLVDYDVKIYATDVDEEELVTARRGEYSAEALNRVRSEWREKYFYGKGLLRVNRDIRRLVIFGRSNLAHDAPISHVNLLVCRNVLIYFDAALQKQILARLHYALDPGGVLFLGKSESQLANSKQFKRLNPRWRIFQRISRTPAESPPATSGGRDQAPEWTDTAREELNMVRAQQRFMLDALNVGVLVLGPDDVVRQHNSSFSALYGLPATSLIGSRIQDTEIFARTPAIGEQLQATHLSHQAGRIRAHITVRGEDRLLEINIRPLLDERSQRTGTYIYCEDVSVQERLQYAVDQLESTSEELQSANEELETTNEELQSTNEELETTNEELQSTNEELETTNEELQSLNEELETTNQELEERTKNLDELNSTYAQTFEKLRIPIMLVNQDRRIEFWNSTLIRVFGFKTKPPMELQLEQLPFPQALRSLIVRRHRSVLVNKQPSVARGMELGGTLPLVDIHFSIIPKDERTNNVLIMFEPQPGSDGRHASHTGSSNSKKSKARTGLATRKR